MSTLALELVLRKIHDLPSLPIVVMELLGSIGKEDVNIEELSEKISRDQALTAKTLRLANSSFYGMQRKVTTINEAIAILGFHCIYNLAATASLVGSFTKIEHSNFNLRPFWRHSIATAVCARVLASQLRIDAEHAYTAGLLHDIGRVVLATQFPQDYEAVMDFRATHDSRLIEAENAVLGIDHAAVGQALAVHWKFPESIQQAVAFHHSAEVHQIGSMASLIHIADAIAHALDLSMDEDDLVPPICLGAWNRLKLDQNAFLQVFQEAEQQFKGACQVLPA
jgi:putative nucleotidyltransferase with HDIG domain